jgi:hypothetical protein
VQSRRLIRPSCASAQTNGCLKHPVFNHMRMHKTESGKNVHRGCTRACSLALRSHAQLPWTMLNAACHVCTQRLQVDIIINNEQSSMTTCTKYRIQLSWMNVKDAVKSLKRAVTSVAVVWYESDATSCGSQQSCEPQSPENEAEAPGSMMLHTWNVPPLTGTAGSPPIPSGPHRMCD